MSSWWLVSSWLPSALLRAFVFTVGRGGASFPFVLLFLLSSGFVAFPHGEVAKRECPLTTEVSLGLRGWLRDAVAGDGQAPHAKV